MPDEPATRPDGTPLATWITPEVRKWLCSGGVDPERVMALGIPQAWLLALWNVRVSRKECNV